jgi:DHA1 family bicyclomycin/chloramphenicol resistance-like MFS transporter
VPAKTIRAPAPRSDAAGQGTSRLGFVVTLGTIAAISATAIDICVPAQPDIAREFGQSPSAGGALVSSYFWGYALGQLVWGPLSDRFGRLTPLRIGLIGFLLTSIACAMDHDMALLIALRFAQGLFGGSAPITVRAIARDQGGGDRTGSLLATVTMIIGIAPLLAPPFGSALLLAFDWRSTFWFLAVFAVVVLGGIAAFVRIAPHPRPDPGGPSYAARALPVLRHFDFITGAAVFAILGFGYFALLSVGAAAARERYGVSGQGVGPLFSIVAVGFMCGSIAARRTVGRFRRDSILLVCSLVAAASGLILAGTLGLGLPQWLFWGLLTAYDFAFGLANSVAMAKALEPAGKAAGAAASLLGLASLSVGAIGSQLAASPLYAGPYHAVCQQMAAAGLACLLLQLFVIWRGRRRERPIAVVAGAPELAQPAPESASR